jgi:cadmium resistance protein CadD (predicted permease)
MITYYSITLAFMAFLSTTLDDFTVVLIFFGREYVKTHNMYDPKTRAAFFSIVLGQFLAFTIIVVIALGIGIGLRKAISDSYIDLIGFLPVMIGLYKIYEILDEDGYLECCWNGLCCVSPKSDEGDAGHESDALVPESGDRDDTILSTMDRDVLSQMVANAYGSQGIFDGRKNPADGGNTPSEGIRNTPVVGETGLTTGHTDTTDEGNSELKADKISSCRDPLIEEVTLFGLLFGVDNISIYVSLICNMTDTEIVAVLVVFYSLLTFYLGIALLIITKVAMLNIIHLSVIFCVLHSVVFSYFSRNYFTI